MERTADLESQIVARGRDLFASIGSEKPSLFDKNRWTGMVMDWCMKNEDFKVQLFRFIDVFPCLTTTELLARHIQEYFGAADQDIPAILKWGARGARLGGTIGGKVLHAAIRHNIQDMARQFIIGDNLRTAVENLGELRGQGFAFVVDVLGEATVSEQEADQYVATYTELLRELREARKRWTSLTDTQESQGVGDLDWGHAPEVNVSVKPTALYSQVKPSTSRVRSSISWSA